MRVPRGWGRRIAFMLPAFLLACGLLWCVIYRPDHAINVGTASVSQVFCEEVFIAGLDPRRVFDEEVLPRPGLRPLLKRLRYTIDNERRQVTTTWAGHFASTVHYRDGYGCLLSSGDEAHATVTHVAAKSSPAPDILSTTAPGVITNTNLEKALDRAFAEPATPPYRHVRAVVVMRNGKIIGERYAQGISTDTPLLGYSASKSVINALVGILVREGKLQTVAPAPVGAWSDPADPRHAITLDQLLRMTSGLDLTEGDSGFDPVSKMLFQHSDDMAGYAGQAALTAKPGSVWEYTSGNTLIVSAIIRNAVGGHAADVQRFARDELLGPLGMHHTTIELDGAGTPVGSTRILASARDWARFGQLYLDDGVVHGVRLLPEGWVHYSTTPTLDSDYGTGFWVNAGHAPNALGRVKSGMPADTFYASGLFGQRVVVVPSQRLVIVRLGATLDPPDFDIEGLERLVADVIAAEHD